jgi:Fe-S-cluster containining protein
MLAQKAKPARTKKRKKNKDAAITNSRQNTRKVPIRLDLPEGRIEAEIDLPQATMRLVDLAAVVLELSSTVAEMGTRNIARLGRQVSCSKGCGACCHQVTPLAPPEAFMIAEWVQSLAEKPRNRLQDRFAEARLLLERSGILPKLARLQKPSALSEETMRDLSQEYFQQQLPCPFLENESCSIYPMRPSRCREYLVTSSPIHCQNPYDQQVDRLPVSIRLSEALARLWAEATQTPLQLIPLPLALEWSSQNKHNRTIGADAKMMLQGLLLHVAKIAADHERQAQSENKNYS